MELKSEKPSENKNEDLILGLRSPRPRVLPENSNNATEATFSTGGDVRRLSSERGIAFFGTTTGGARVNPNENIVQTQCCVIS